MAHQMISANELQKGDMIYTDHGGELVWIVQSVRKVGNVVMMQPKGIFEPERAMSNEFKYNVYRWTF